MFDVRSISSSATCVEVFRSPPQKVLRTKSLQAVHQIGAVTRFGEYRQVDADDGSRLR